MSPPWAISQTPDTPKHALRPSSTRAIAGQRTRAHATLTSEGQRDYIFAWQFARLLKRCKRGVFVRPGPRAKKTQG
eukprot:11406707-Alexandrium_andersonii.AAC.1